VAHRILIIEDEPAIADTITYALKTEGLAVEWCSTGKDALALLGKGIIHLIIIDVGLPDMSGFDLCKEVRRTSRIPVIFLTARSDEVDRVVGLEIGGDDYVTKPFSPRELAARVKAVLRRGTGEGSGPEEATDVPFALDGKRLTITYYGKPLDLSRYEFRLLEVLIERPGWVFSRDQLKDLVWEEPESSMDRTVDTHIKTIRSKLREIDPDRNPIQTHRGLGYSLRESY
jgi:two-component system catabolic regulation response regulator CreB